MNSTTRRRGILLRLLDLTRIEEEALGAYLAMNPDSGATGMDSGFSPYAVSDVIDGVRYVVCQEGVGWSVTEDQPFHLDLYPRRSGVLSIAPAMTAIITLRDLDDLVTDETVDLADLIRTFGQRLEDNFEVWATALTPRQERSTQ